MFIINNSNQRAVLFHKMLKQAPFLSGWQYISKYINRIAVDHGGSTAGNTVLWKSIIAFALIIFSFAGCDSTETENLGRLSGSVQASYSGEFISGAEIVVSDVELETTADVAGRFTLLEIPVGEFTISAIAENYLMRRIPEVEIWRNETTRISFRLPRRGAVGSLEGKISSATTGLIIAGAKVTVMGESLFSTSDDSGNYSISNIPEGPYSLRASGEGLDNNNIDEIEIVKDSTTTINFVLSPSLLGGSGLMRIVLSWGERPADLDSHIKTPVIDNQFHHVFWSSRGDSSSAPNTWLDVDDVTSYGPETITFYLAHPGYYYYYIKNYTASVAEFPEQVMPLSGSEAQVEIYDRDGARERFEVPTVGSGLFWNVCMIDLRSMSIIPVNQLQDEEPGPQISENSAMPVTRTLKPSSSYNQ